MRRAVTRRWVVRGLGVLAGAGSLGLRAEELPRLEEGEREARALFYVHEVSRLDRSSPFATRYEPGQSCANCQYLGGEAGPAWRPCSWFPGRLVSVRGWCSMWSARS